MVPEGAAGRARNAENVEVDAHRRHGSRARRGFTLIEVMLTTVVVGMAVVAVSWMITHANKTQAMHQAETVDPLLLAREVYELAETLDPALSGSGPASAPSEVLALDSLDGASFSPPIRADLTEIATSSGWTQQVDLVAFDVSDLTTKTSDSVQGTQPTGSALIYRVDVTILEGSSVVDTYSWWLNP